MDVYLVASARTPFAARNAALAGWHPVDLLSATVERLVRATGVDAVDFAVGATSSPIGEAAVNSMRNSLLAAGLSEDVAAVTVDSGGMTALDLAVTLLRSGHSDVVVVGAVDSSTRVPPGASSGTAVGKPYGRLVHERYEARDGLRPPGLMAEEMAVRNGISRADVAAYVADSTTRARLVRPDLVALERRNEKGRPIAGLVDVDEWRVLPDEVQPMFLRGGLINAASFRSDGDGAVSLLLCNERALGRFDAVRCRVMATASVGVSLVEGSSGASLAQALAKHSDSEPSVSVSEDSAITPLVLAADLGASVNPTGGFLGRSQPPATAGLAELADRADGTPQIFLSAGSSPTSAGVLLG